MGLADNKPMYNRILSDVRRLVIKSKVNPQLGIRRQDTLQIGAIQELARDKHPYLGRFENDWATSQIIIQYLANRRKSDKKYLEAHTKSTPSNGCSKSATKASSNRNASSSSTLVDEARNSRIGRTSKAKAAERGSRGGQESRLRKQGGDASELEGVEEVSDDEQDATPMEDDDVSGGSVVDDGAIDDDEDEEEEEEEPAPKRRKLAHVVPV
ncbi:hypothetical protein C8Q76DRAFT_246814 [Earliella scabrosa]|nr:hypothetical protein C8Q76DRAFT_246814 [Earliella scabrosa]